MVPKMHEKAVYFFLPRLEKYNACCTQGNHKFTGLGTITEKTYKSWKEIKSKWTTSVIGLVQRFR